MPAENTTKNKTMNYLDQIENLIHLRDFSRDI